MSHWPDRAGCVPRRTKVCKGRPSTAPADHEQHANSSCSNHIRLVEVFSELVLQRDNKSCLHALYLHPMTLQKIAARSVVLNLLDPKHELADLHCELHWCTIQGLPRNINVLAQLRGTCKEERVQNKPLQVCESREFLRGCCVHVAAMCFWCVTCNAARVHYAVLTLHWACQMGKRTVAVKKSRAAQLHEDNGVIEDDEPVAIDSTLLVPQESPCVTPVTTAVSITVLRFHLMHTRSY
jgi:hypothetical protein